MITSEPSFLVYRKAVQAQGGRNVVIPLKDGTHDLERIAQAVTPRTRIIFLDNPTNPMGTVIPSRRFEAFLSTLPDGLIVALDEAYMEFVRDPDTPRGKDLVHKDRRVAFLRTFSKAYGLAGLRAGYGIMDEEVARNLEKVRQPFNMNSMAQVAALAALDDRDYLKQVLKITWEGMDGLTAGLKGMGCRPLPSQTNYILVDVGKDADVIYKQMLKTGVIIRSMASYGFPTHIRITIGLPEENKRCLAALKEALENA